VQKPLENKGLFIGPNLSAEGKRKKIDALKPNHVDAMANFTRRALYGLFPECSLREMVLSKEGAKAPSLSSSLFNHISIFHEDANESPFDRYPARRFH
jgi:hypothetical protein